MKRRSLLRAGRALLTLAAGWVVAAGLTSCRSPDPRAPGPDAAVIQLTGDAIGTTLFIDDLILFRITPANDQRQFIVRPGKHYVRLDRNGVMIVEKTLSVARGQTMELNVP